MGLFRRFRFLRALEVERETGGEREREEEEGGCAIWASADSSEPRKDMWADQLMPQPGTSWSRAGWASSPPTRRRTYASSVFEETWRSSYSSSWSMAGSATTSASSNPRYKRTDVFDAAESVGEGGEYEAEWEPGEGEGEGEDEECDQAPLLFWSWSSAESKAAGSVGVEECEAGWNWGWTLNRMREVAFGCVIPCGGGPEGLEGREDSGSAAAWKEEREECGESGGKTASESASEFCEESASGWAGRERREGG